MSTPFPQTPQREAFARMNRISTHLADDSHVRPEMDAHLREVLAAMTKELFGESAND